MGLDPSTRQLFRSSTPDHCRLNFVGYKNPRADERMVRIRREYNEARQIEMARELHRLIAEDQPYTFLYVRRVLALMDAKIVRMVVGPDRQPQYLPFVPDKLGRLSYHFHQWIKTPAPVFPPYRPELNQG